MKRENKLTHKTQPLHSEKDQDYGGEDEEMEEDAEEDLEEEEEGEQSQVTRQSKRTGNAKRTNATMKNNPERASVMDNTQNTFHGLNRTNNQIPTKAAYTKRSNLLKTMNQSVSQYTAGQEDEENEEDYEEEVEEETQSKFSQSKYSQPMTTYKINTQPTNPHAKPRGLQEQNRLPQNPNQDYLTSLKQRKQGEPIKTMVPQNIEDFRPIPKRVDIMDTKTTQREIIPSFLPNGKNIAQFKKIADQDELQYGRQVRQQYQDDTINVTRQAIKHRAVEPAYHDPFEAHMQKMEDKLKEHETYSAGDSYYSHAVKGQNMKSPLHTHKAMDRSAYISQLSEEFNQDPYASAPDKIRRNNGFHSVQRERNPIKMVDEQDGGMKASRGSSRGAHIVKPLEVNFPEIRDKIQTLEHNMEKELDKEARLKKDAKRLIVHAMGKNNGELGRTVKAWLKKEDDQVYINEGQPYTKEYRQLIQKEIGRDKQNFQIMDKFLKNGLFEQPAIQNGLQAAKEKYRKDHMPKQDEQGIKFDYTKIKELYNISLLDIHLSSPEAYLLKKKEDAKATITHVFKRKFEEKLIFQQMNNPKTLRSDKIKLEEKLRMISIAIELAKQRLEWLTYDTPFTIEELEREVKEQKVGGLPNIPNNFQIDKKFQAQMQKQAREARNLLTIQMLEVRALKNRTGCESISDFVLLFREFTHIERLEDLQMLFQDALLNKKKAQDFYNFIKKIVDFEDEIVRVRSEFTTEKIEERRLNGDEFFNYDEVTLQKVNGQEKEQFMKSLQQTKIIYQFIPFWYIPISQESQNANQLRSLFKFDMPQTATLVKYLKCTTLEEIVTYHRHNRRKKEFILFDREELSFLNREQMIPTDLLKEFAQTILLLAKESLMVPDLLFKLAKPTNITEINFSNYKGEHMTSDAMATIVACIEMHQTKVKKLIFENCALDVKSAQLLKIVLSDERKPIISCNFDQNNLGDAGIDHIVQAIKNNPKGDMRILRVSNNQLSIQASIRLSHVLKKRANNLAPLNLQVLKMSHNQVGNIGTETLANFINKNDTLKYLDLSFNQIGDRGLLSLAQCLLTNVQLQVLNILGNEFTQKPLQPFSQALVDNKNSKLLILKIGDIKCDQQSFLNFINNGFMISTQQRYLYLTSNNYNHEVVQTMNDSFLPKVLYATETHDPSIDTDILLNFMTNTIESQLLEGGINKKVIQFGEELLQEIIQEKYKQNSIEILIYLFESIFGPDYILKDSLSPFHLFAKSGQIEMVTYCLKMGVSPNFKTSIAYKDYPSATALHLAAGYSQIDLCQQMIKYGVEIDSKDLNGNTAMHYSCVQGSYLLIQLLIDNGASLLVTNKENMLPLHSCIFSDNVTCFKYIASETEKQKAKQYYGKLVEKIVDIKAYKGLTPIMIAQEEDAQAIFEYLLDNRADLKAQDEEGNTVLHRAILNKDERKTKQLIKAGADIYLKSFNGESALMMAVRIGLMDVVRLLVKMEADLNEKNYRGDSLLHLAARGDRADIIGFLLDKGLSTQDKNRDGLRPSDVAVRAAIKEMLSHNNQQNFNVFKEKQSIQQKGQRLSNNSKQLPTDNNKPSASINEQMVKYKIDKRETMGKNRLPQFQASKMSKVSQGIDKTEEDEEDEEEEDEDGEEQFDEEEEDEEEEHKTTMPMPKKGLGQLLHKDAPHAVNRLAVNKDALKQNAIPQTKNKLNHVDQSAGFRGTIDISSQQNLPTKTKTDNIFNKNSTVQEDEEMDQDEEYEEEQEEEQEEDMSQANQSRVSHNTYKTNKQKTK